ncbi:DUF4225 domain-containing protein [Klebsiella aerogenes]|uniref:DUF4225 domain-containing protein n=1 Tax=Klebsiella TaxID=570 RepID=UPI00063C341A|nr:MULTISPECIES: DUF4225 domain-containing protein [Klebsiella]EKW8936559.1 DUF4225 domain-containing protein [Klebsiella aerogenes]KLF09024.1 hypothetical protein YA27_16300 [Klebsiella aerogenes]MDU9355514.1 DUF4225 domain-containing protein [Klebsiella sp. 141153]
MDITLFNRGWNRTWSDTMVNLEARKLIETANRLSAFHLHDGLTRIKFVEEIKQVVEKEFAAARRAKTDEECVACIKNLRTETNNLEEQGRLVRTRVAQLYAKIEFVRENNKIVGYVISAIQVVVSGMAIAGGVLMVSTMTPIGMLAGAILVMDGINGLSKEIIPGIYGKEFKTQGFVADAAMEMAHFMGFKPETGLALYNTLTLGASVYSIFGLASKPEAWRLFRWMPRDFYRQVDTMSRPKLTMKIVGYGLKAKVIFDLFSTEAPYH